MILDNFPKVLWINLDQSTNRKRYMEYLLKQYSIRNYRIKAVDATNPKYTELSDICVKNDKLSLPENACTCSHLQAMKYFVDNISDNVAIIMEDDVSFEFLENIPYSWSELMSHLPAKYDVIQLAITKFNGSVNSVLIKTDPSSKYYCSAAYLITKQAAQRILNKYYNTQLAKYNLSIQNHATADSVISSTGATFSIPIFTYLTNDSTIHPRHISIHNKSKQQQCQLWRTTSVNFNKKTYFAMWQKN